MDYSKLKENEELVKFEDIKIGDKIRWGWGYPATEYDSETYPNGYVTVDKLTEKQGHIVIHSIHTPFPTCEAREKPTDTVIRLKKEIQMKYDCTKLQDNEEFVTKEQLKVGDEIRLTSGYPYGLKDESNGGYIIITKFKEDRGEYQIFAIREGKEIYCIDANDCTGAIVRKSNKVRTIAIQLGIDLYKVVKTLKTTEELKQEIQDMIKGI